jgi:hypothetical protein
MKFSELFPYTFKALRHELGHDRPSVSRYLQSRRHVLDAMGISPKAQKLPPQAVRYICEDYCIDLPPELQNQDALSKSPLYQKFLLALQESEPFY